MLSWSRGVALVTGASRGIGAAICKTLVADEGMDVFGCARNVKDVEKLAQCSEMINSKGKLHPIKCDVSQEDQVLAMFDEIKRKFGRIDICINNAGIIEYAPLMSGNVSDWKRVMEVNVLGMCICTRETLKLMKEKNINDGIIIQMGSIGGHKIASIPKGSPDPGVAIYNGTKFMVRALAEALRQELRSQYSRIRVTTISPGPVKTAMLEKVMSSESAAAYLKSVKCLDPEDIADLVRCIMVFDHYVNVDDIIIQSVDFHV